MNKTLARVAELSQNVRDELLGHPINDELQNPPKIKRGDAAQSKYWCFTLNNPAAEEDNIILRMYPHSGDLPTKGAVCTYLVVGKEVGMNGTHHLQGYVEFDKKVRMSFVKKFMPRAHLERRRGTAIQAAAYCMKEGSYQQYGMMSCVHTDD